MRWEPHLEVVVKPGRPAGIRFGRHATIGFVPHRILDDAVAIAHRSLGQQRAGPLEVGSSVVLLLETHGVLDCDGEPGHNEPHRGGTGQRDEDQVSSQWPGLAAWLMLRSRLCGHAAFTLRVESTAIAANFQAGGAQYWDATTHRSLPGYDVTGASRPRSSSIPRDRIS